MKRLLSIVAGGISAIFLMAVVFSVFYYTFLKPMKQGLPTKAEIKAVSDNLAETRRQCQIIQEQLDREQLQRSLSTEPIKVAENDEVIRLESEMRRLEDLKKEVGRLEELKKKVQCLAKEPTPSSSK